MTGRRQGGSYLFKRVDPADILVADARGIGSLPIVYFGTSDQKQRYLPDLASCAKVAAYSFTETGSGSDALAAKTTARLTPDGTSYLLNGTKQWTSNAGFADLSGMTDGRGTDG